ncbi:MAG: AAA domain-containing protein, partial [Candidatus Aceula meridiana]|nr:AAA domain-containing protein [Candidatus Aceula meridiana]
MSDENDLIEPIEPLDPKEAILEVLKANPGQRASDLAIELDLEKKEINSFLYGELKDQCVQDEKYCWFLLKDAPAHKKEEKKALPKTALSSLAQYYLSCIGQDDEGGVSAFAESKYGGLDYAELPNLPLSASDSLFESSDAQRLLGKMRKDRSRLAMFLGYPSSLKEIRSKKSNWTGYILEPILLFPIEISGGSPKLSQGFPMFNLSALKRFTNTQREQLMDELVQLEDELGLTSDQDIPEFDDLVRRLASIRTEWPWKEEIDPAELVQDPALSTIKEEGIFNRAVLIVGERSPYTQGLETELKSLADVTPEQYEHTALGQWIKGEIGSKGEDNKMPLLEVLPLNSEQRQAIQQSLTNPLTIITGPPGTGKSQVVTNLLVNAAWQGKKVLFASKNNKAVDVVEIRINNLASRPILLRMGSNQYQVKLAEYLIGLLTATSTEHDQEEFDFDLNQYKQLEEKWSVLEKKESELINLRNEVDELD